MFRNNLAQRFKLPFQSEVDRGNRSASRKRPRDSLPESPGTAARVNWPLTDKF